MSAGLAVGAGTFRVKLKRLGKRNRHLMGKKGSADDQAPPDFETALQELERLVEQLEGGELSLAASLEHFEHGVRLSRQCHSLLDQARQSVELLMQPDSEDSAEPFDVKDAGASSPAETSD